MNRKGKVERQTQLLRELRSLKCFCGARKSSNWTFCRADYLSLPSSLRDDLYSHFGQGYEEAYDSARAWLEAEIERKKDAPL
jgi:hypothetical protein